MKRILVVWSYPTVLPLRRAIQDHLQALDGGPERIVYHNAYSDSARRIRGLEFDAVLLHTTFLCERWSPFFAKTRRRYAWIANLPCTKIAMPQDEYDHSEILDEWLAELGVSDIFTIFGEDVRPVLYPSLHRNARFHPALTGYIDDAGARSSAARIRPISERPVDVVYRATNLPYWFGSHGQLKHGIGEIVNSRAPAHDLTVDISTRWEDTILGDAWNEFLMSGRAIIGTESGSSVLDRRGEIQARVKTLLADRPEMTFDEVSRELPAAWDSWRFFAISPRHFEAVVTKTAQVLIEGTYSGVLEAERHYIPLRQDFSNLDDVLERLHDHRLLQDVVDRAYEEIYIEGAWRYSDFAVTIRHALETGPGHVRPSRKAAFPAIAAANRVRAIPFGVARRAELRLRHLAGALLLRASALLRRTGLRG